MDVPFDIEAEQAVIGACLKGAEPPLLDEADFWNADCRRAWSAVQDLYTHGMPVDVITVADNSGVDSLELLDMQTQTPAAHAVGDYGRIVADHAMRRRAIAACQKITDAAMEGTERFRETAEHLIYTAVASREDATTVTLSTAMGRFIENLEQTQMGVVSNGIPTGIGKLDTMLGGMQRSSVVVIGARPGVGKSALCGNLAVSAAKQGLKVLFASVEMSEQEIAARIMAGEANISWHLLRNRGPETGDWAALLTANEKLDPLPITIIDAPNTSVSDIRSIARRTEPDLIIVDYLQLLVTHTRNESRNLELADLSRSLKLLAREVKAAVVVCSQLNREGERENRAPVLRDLRDSGAIEADADMVWFLHVEAAERDRDPRTINLIVRKNRNGPTGTIPLSFYPSTTTFREA